MYVFYNSLIKKLVYNFVSKIMLVSKMIFCIISNIFPTLKYLKKCKCLCIIYEKYCVLIIT